MFVFNATGNFECLRNFFASYANEDCSYLMINMILTLCLLQIIAHALTLVCFIKNNNFETPIYRRVILSQTLCIWHSTEHHLIDYIFSI